MKVTKADVVFTNYLLLEPHALIKAIDANAPKDSLSVSLAESAEMYGANWAFEAAGTYTVTFEVTGTRASDGGRVVGIGELHLRRNQLASPPPAGRPGPLQSGPGRPHVNQGGSP